jgi:hypothetical protein
MVPISLQIQDFNRPWQILLPFYPFCGQFWDKRYGNRDEQNGVED